MPAYDLIICGLGAMGSATAFHAAKRGGRVLGLDRFAPPHVYGSSHGQTRIIREAYFEHPSYVPLVQRAYELWRELEVRAGEQLFRQTGGLMIGPEDGTLVRGARTSAELHHLPHEILSAAAVKARFPSLHVPEHSIAIMEPRAGILFPERCIAAHLEQAQAAGATLRFNEKIENWSANSDGVRVSTASGSYHGKALVFSSGSWLKSLVPQGPVSVERQTMFWFEPRAGSNLAELPIYMWEYERERFLYGFPDIGYGAKVARHHEGILVDPDHVPREVSAAEVESMRQLIHPLLPDLDGGFKEATVCIYTNIPDGHFLLDRHPEFEPVWLVSPCSGHGFKFSSAIGEIVCELVEKGRSEFDLSLFRWRWPDQ